MDVEIIRRPQKTTRSEIPSSAFLQASAQNEKRRLGHARPDPLLLHLSIPDNARASPAVFVHGHSSTLSRPSICIHRRKYHSSSPLAGRNCPLYDLIATLNQSHDIWRRIRQAFGVRRSVDRVAESIQSRSELGYCAIRLDSALIILPATGPDKLIDALRKTLLVLLSFATGFCILPYQPLNPPKPDSSRSLRHPWNGVMDARFSTFLPRPRRVQPYSVSSTCAMPTGAWVELITPPLHRPP